MKVTRDMYAGETDVFTDLLEVLLRSHDRARLSSDEKVVTKALEGVMVHGMSYQTALIIVRRIMISRLAHVLPELEGLHA